MVKVGYQMRRFAPLAALGVSVLLSACAADGKQDGPQTTAAADSKSCQDARRELDRLDARGVPSRIEAVNQGKKLSAAQKTEVDHYNRLLQQYLGGRCHL